MTFLAVKVAASLALTLVLSEAAMTSDQETKVLARHNKVRSETALRSNTKWNNEIPCTAADMEKMVWVTSLATEAQAYAEKCVADHPAEAGSAFGENLFFGTGGTACDTACLESGVQAWYDEIVDTIWTINDKSPKSKALADCKDVSGSYCNVGHYFQVIEATTNQVGCGVAACPSLTSSGSALGAGYLMVCRYQKPGKNNGQGTTYQPPFLFGAAGAACAGNVENGLCTKTPTRCVDKDPISITIGATKYTSCSTVKDAEVSNMKWCGAGGLAELMGAQNDCPATCGTCTPPANMGSQHCGSSNTQSGGSQKEKVSGPKDAPKQEGELGQLRDSRAGEKATPKTYTGNFAFGMSKEHATALTADLTKAKLIFKKALEDMMTAKSLSFEAIKIGRIAVDNQWIAEGGGRRLSDASVKVEYEIKTTGEVSAVKSNIQSPAFSSNIEAAAKKEGITVSVTKAASASDVGEGSLTATSTTAAAKANVGGTSGAVQLSVRTGFFSALIAFFALG